MTKELAIESALLRASWIDSTLLSGVLLSLAVCLIHRQRKSEFEILSVRLPLRWFPAACVGFTVAHLYCTVLFVKLFMGAPNPQVLRETLALKGPLVFNGMMPRKTLWSVSSPSGQFPFLTHIEVTDPTQWLFYGFCAVTFFGFKWSCEVAGYSKKRTRWMAASLLAINWIAGSLWANSMSIAP